MIKKFKRGLSLLITSALVLSSMLSVMGTSVLAAPPSLNATTHYYLAGSAPQYVLSGLELDGEGIFAGGHMKITVNGADADDQLSFRTVTEAVYTNGVVSLVENTGASSVTADVYVGVSGSYAKHLGTVSPVDDGYGYIVEFSPLDESHAIVIGSGDFSDWQIMNHPVHLKNEGLASKTQGRSVTSTSLGGGLYRIDGTYADGSPYSFISDVEYRVEGVDKTDMIQSPASPFSGSYAGGVLTLGSDNSTQLNEYRVGTIGSIFGPEAFSPTFTASSGDALAFDWKAQGGGDNYEIYGFLVNANNENIEIVYGRGNGKTIPTFNTTYGTILEENDYQFRFVAGSHDQTDGGVVGASLQVKNVRIFKSVPTDAVLEQIADLVTYYNPSPDASTDKEIVVEVQNINGTTERDTASYTVDVEPQLKLIRISINDAVPNQAILEFNLPVSATLTAADFAGFMIHDLEVVDVIDDAEDETVTVVLEDPLSVGPIDIRYDGSGNIRSTNPVLNNVLRSIGDGDLDSDQLENNIVPLELEQVVIDGERPTLVDLVFNKSVADTNLTPNSPVPGLTIGGKPVMVIAIDDTDPTVVHAEISEPYEPGDQVNYEPRTEAERIIADGNKNNVLPNISSGAGQPAQQIVEESLKLISAISLDDTPDRVTLTFNRPIDDASFTYTGLRFNGLHVKSVVPDQVNDEVVVLELTDTLTPTTDFALFVEYDKSGSPIGSYYNPTTNRLDDIAGAHDIHHPSTARNGVVALELVKVSTNPVDPHLLTLTFNKPIAIDRLTPNDVVGGLTIGTAGSTDKPVTYVNSNAAGDTITVRLDDPYLAGDAISYTQAAGDIVRDNNARNLLRNYVYESIPLVSGKIAEFRLEAGGQPLTLSPAYDPNNNDGDGEGYRAIVPNTVSHISIEPVAYNVDDTVTKVIFGGQEFDAVDWGSIGELQEGSNLITVRVYDQDDVHVDGTVKLGALPLEEYTINVIRATTKLVDLIPSSSDGANLEFRVTDDPYELSVGYYVNPIHLTTTTLDPYAVINISVNDGPKQLVTNSMKSPALDLQVGRNTIIVSVTDSAGDAQDYTVFVNRASMIIIGDAPVRTEHRTVDVLIGGDDAEQIVKLNIKRSYRADGKIIDQVLYATDKALESVAKAQRSGEYLARIVVPDTEDQVSEVVVDIPQDTIALLQEHAMDLEIYNSHAVAHIPSTSLEGLNEALLFQIIPVRDPSLRHDKEDRVRTEQIVQDLAGGQDAHVVTRPLTIETNMPSHSVDLIIPIPNDQLPDQEHDRALFMAGLYVFIEQIDSEGRLVKGEPIVMLDGQLGLRFSTDTFNTFTVINVQGDTGSHQPYINGYPNGDFGPENGLLRSELAMMLYNLGALGSTTGEGYPDLPDNHWAATAIKRAQASGLLVGYMDGTFQPDRSVTRAEMAAFAYRYLNLGQASRSIFPDVPESHWAHPYIMAIGEEGWMVGRPDGTFGPDQEITRAEAVTLLNRMFNRGPLHGVTAPSWPDVPTSHWAFEDIEEASIYHHYSNEASHGETLIELGR